MSLEFLLVVFFLFEFFFTIGFSLYVIKWTINENSLFSMVKIFLSKLFIGRNTFGLILSSIVFVITIPSLIMLIITELMIIIGDMFVLLWNLGKKEEKI
jgi:hypothetical protein